MSKGVEDLMSVPSQREAIKGRDPQWEIPDPTPVSIPVGAERPPTIQEMLAMYLANDAVRQELEDEGFETFEEADDFEPEEEDMLPMSEYEITEYQMEAEVEPHESAASLSQAELALDLDSGEATPSEAENSGTELAKESEENNP
jgi:hypothetical protein